MRNTSVNLAMKEKGAMPTLYFTPKQTREIIADAGTTGFTLMQHYVAIGKMPNPNMEDAVLAKLIGLSVPTIKKVRLTLTQLGWFKRMKTTYKNEPQIIYIVGKEAVQSSTHAVIS